MPDRNNIETLVDEAYLRTDVTPTIKRCSAVVLRSLVTCNANARDQVRRKLNAALADYMLPDPTKRTCANVLKELHEMERAFAHAAREQRKHPQTYEDIGSLRSGVIERRATTASPSVWSGAKAGGRHGLGVGDDSIEREFQAALEHSRHTAPRATTSRVFSPRASPSPPRTPPLRGTWSSGYDSTQGFYSPLKGSTRSQATLQSTALKVGMNRFVRGAVKRRLHEAFGTWGRIIEGSKVRENSNADAGADAIRGLAEASPGFWREPSPFDGANSFSSVDSHIDEQSQRVARLMAMQSRLRRGMKVLKLRARRCCASRVGLYRAWKWALRRWAISVRWRHAHLRAQNLLFRRRRGYRKAHAVIHWKRLCQYARCHRATIQARHRTRFQRAKTTESLVKVMIRRWRRRAQQSHGRRRILQQVDWRYSIRARMVAFVRWRVRVHSAMRVSERAERISTGLAVMGRRMRMKRLRLGLYTMARVTDQSWRRRARMAEIESVLYRGMAPLIALNGFWRWRLNAVERLTRRSSKAKEMIDAELKKYAESSKGVDDLRATDVSKVQSYSSIQAAARRTVKSFEPAVQGCPDQSPRRRVLTGSEVHGQSRPAWTSKDSNGNDRSATNRKMSRVEWLASPMGSTASSRLKARHSAASYASLAEKKQSAGSVGVVQRSRAPAPAIVGVDLMEPNQSKNMIGVAKAVGVQGTNAVGFVPGEEAVSAPIHDSPRHDPISNRSTPTMARQSTAGSRPPSVAASYGEGAWFSPDRNAATPKAQSIGSVKSVKSSTSVESIPASTSVDTSKRPSASPTGPSGNVRAMKAVVETLSPPQLGKVVPVPVVRPSAFVQPAKTSKEKAVETTLSEVLDRHLSVRASSLELSDEEEEAVPAAEDVTLTKSSSSAKRSSSIVADMKMSQAKIVEVDLSSSRSQSAATTLAPTESTGSAEDVDADMMRIQQLIAAELAQAEKKQNKELRSQQKEIEAKRVEMEMEILRVEKERAMAEKERLALKQQAEAEAERLRKAESERKAAEAERERIEREREELRRKAEEELLRLELAEEKRKAAEAEQRAAEAQALLAAEKFAEAEDHRRLQAERPTEKSGVVDSFAENVSYDNMPRSAGRKDPAGSGRASQRTSRASSPGSAFTKVVHRSDSSHSQARSRRGSQSANATGASGVKTVQVTLDMLENSKIPEISKKQSQQSAGEVWDEGVKNRRKSSLESVHSNLSESLRTLAAEFIPTKSAVTSSSSNSAPPGTSGEFVTSTREAAQVADVVESSDESDTSSMVIRSPEEGTAAVVDTHKSSNEFAGSRIVIRTPEKGAGTGLESDDESARSDKPTASICVHRIPLSKVKPILDARASVFGQSTTRKDSSLDSIRPRRNRSITEGNVEITISSDIPEPPVRVQRSVTEYEEKKSTEKLSGSVSARQTPVEGSVLLAQAPSFYRSKFVITRFGLALVNLSTAQARRYMVKIKIDGIEVLKSPLSAHSNQPTFNSCYMVDEVDGGLRKYKVVVELWAGSRGSQVELLGWSEPLSLETMCNGENRVTMLDGGNRYVAAALIQGQKKVSFKGSSKPTSPLESPSWGWGGSEDPRIKRNVSFAVNNAIPKEQSRNATGSRSQSMASGYLSPRRSPVVRE